MKALKGADQGGGRGASGATCLRNMGESSSLVKAAMSVRRPRVAWRRGEAAAALWKLAEEIWAGGRREEEAGGRASLSVRFPCTA